MTHQILNSEPTFSDHVRMTDNVVTCPKCKGRGKRIAHLNEAPHFGYDCEKCGGLGVIEKENKSKWL